MKKAAPLTPVQMRAVAALELGFKQCAEANVHIYGVDDTVLAMPSGYLKRTPITEIDEDQQWRITNVVTHGAYIDSGGW